MNESPFNPAPDRSSEPLVVGIGASARGLKARTDATRGRLTGVHVLVIDDERPNAEMLRDLLALEGASATIATSGRDALAAADAQRFEAIICDIRMSDMSGYDVMRALPGTKCNATTPVIAYTGFGSPDDRKRATAAGFAVHLVKPVTLDRVVEAIEQARSMTPTR